MASVQLHNVGVLPRAVSMLGELGGWVYEFHRDGQLYGMPYRPGSVLVGNAEGTAMWFLRPLREGKVPKNALAMHVAELEQYERFMHRRADKVFNAFVPRFKAPRYVGKLTIIRYLADKGIGEGGEVEWEHYFDGEDAPAPPDLFSLGSGQYFVAPGRWRVGPEGIHYARGG